MSDYNGLDVWQLKRNHKLSLWQRFVRWITKLFGRFVPSLVSGLDPSTLAIVGDISHWNGPNCDVKLMKAGGLSMLFTKACDGQQMYSGLRTDPQTYIDKTMRGNVDKCYRAGIPCGLYIYVKTYWDYFYSWTNQSIAEHHYKMFKESVKGLVPGVSFHAIAIDFEETGQNDYNTNIILGLLFKMLRNDPAFAKLPIIWYSSMRFFNLYPSWMTTVASQGTPHEFWMAQWTFTQAFRDTWDALKRLVIPNIDMRLVTPGFASWRFVQWTATPILPGCSGALDLSFYRGTEAQLYAWLGYTPPVIPPEPPELPGMRMRVVSATDNLMVRSAPSTGAPIVGKLAPGAVVEVEDIGGTGAWIKHAGGWSCVQLSATRFMEVADE